MLLSQISRHHLFVHSQQRQLVAWPCYSWTLECTKKSDIVVLFGACTICEALFPRAWNIVFYLLQMGHAQFLQKPQCCLFHSFKGITFNTKVQATNKDRAIAPILHMVAVYTYSSP